MTLTRERRDQKFVPARMMAGFLRFHYKWYMTTVTLTTLAICLQLMSMKWAATSATTLARANDANDMQTAETALSLAHQSEACGSGGVLLGIVAIACWGVSNWYGEHGRQSMIIVSLAAWFLLIFVMV